MIKKHKSLFEPRNYYKPFEYPQAYEFYELHEKMHWLVDEVPMHQDVLDWKNKLTNQEKHFLTQIFRLFTQSDVDVAGAYANKYIPLFPKPEIRMMLLSFAAREAIHIQAYSHLIDTLGMSEATYKAFMEYEAMREKHDFIEEFMGTDQNMIVQQIAAFSAFTEGMQLFSSFIMLLNFTRFNKMNGMGQIIAWSIKDESVHVDGMTWLFKEFLKEHKDIWTAGDHGSTFGGNYLVTAAALEVLDILENLKDSGTLDETIIYFTKKLNDIFEANRDIFITHVGLGLMRGLRVKDADTLASLIKTAFEFGVMVLKSGNNTLRFLPALTISKSEIDEGFIRLQKAITKIKS